jgi:DNA-binding transcriptional ArsR family regulator
MARRWQTVEKTISADVVELLKGDKDAKALKIVAQVRKVGNQEHLMITVERQVGNATYKTIQSVPFTLAKDKESLVFLKLLREEKDDAGKVTGKVWSLTQPLCDGAPKETVAAAKEALKKLADWEKAPELSAEDAAAIDALVKQLGSDSFETREKATKALTAKGEIARGKLREATKSSDAETGERANRILEAITPAYLKGQQTSTDPSTGVQLIQGGAGVQVIQMEIKAGN